MTMVRVDLRRQFEDAGSRADPSPVYAGLRDLGSVLRSKDILGGGFLLPRYEEVSQVIKDPRFASDRRNVGRRSLDQWWTPGMLRLLLSSMVLKDPPEHRRLRNLVQKAFTPCRVAKLAGRVEEITDELLDAAAAKPVIELVGDLALPLPLTVIAEMLGVPPADRIRFRTLFASIQSNSQTTAVSLARNYRRMRELTTFLQELVRLRRDQPGDDLLSDLVHVEEGGDRLDDDELISMVFLLLFAGHETTVNLIGNGVLELVRRPDQLRKLRDDPGLIDTAIEEMLRFINPVGFVAPRFAKEDVEIAGTPIRRGSMVTLLIASANLDETVFPDADTLDITRSPNRHVSFGLGTHFCLGAPLARLEARIAVPALLRRFDHLELAVPADQLPWRRHIALRGVERLPLVVTPAGASASRRTA
ncbi:cytochrome P450 [Pseudonocardia alni]|uniref:Cytochrome P450 n=1 Tax=Pseudonocardia alni subsp. carboxydivorans TaxID=415010 RepID=A0ABU9AIH6_PSEA5